MASNTRKPTNRGSHARKSFFIVKKRFFIEDDDLGDGMKRVAIAIIALRTLSSAYTDKVPYIHMNNPCEKFLRNECFALYGTIPIGTIVTFNFRSDIDYLTLVASN